MEKYVYFIILAVIVLVPIILKTIALPKEIKTMQEKHFRKTEERKARAHAMMKEYEQQQAENVTNNQNINS